MLEKLSSISTGKLIHGFNVKKIFNVEEFRLSVVQMNHEKSGANHWHLIRDDPNKTFGVQFRTTPFDSSGVSHILEHTALCGSQKFPVRDPFFKMLRRSQASFMNAMTASDWTIYPFSTMNNADFHNLLSVYSDATFFPKLNKLDFMQEGWRLEPKDLKNLNSELLLKGVVYNEMKGVFSNSLNLFGQAVENNLFPISYGHISGGDPDVIPTLTWEALRKFHSDFYHPSNANIYTYGNLDLEETLKYLDSECLSKFTAQSPSPTVPLEPKWSEPRTIRLTCQSDPTNADPTRTCVTSLSFALQDICNVYDNLVLSIVCTLLMDGDNAPLYQGLIESGLGLDWAGPVAGMDKNNRTTSFHIGLQGVRPEDTDHITPAIMEILAKAANTGFPKERVDAVLHQFEIAVREDSARFGLNLIIGLASIVNHGGDVQTSLAVQSLIGRFKDQLAADPTFLQKIVRNYLVENTHRLTTIMQPTQEWAAQQKKLDEDRLEKLTTNMTPTDRQELAKSANLLAQTQNVDEDLSCLPCLSLVDIPAKCRPEPFTEVLVMDRSVQVNLAPTNGLVYFHTLADLSDLPEDLLVYVPIFSDLFTRLGTEGKSYSEMDQMTQANTGSIGSCPHVITSVSPNDTSCSKSVHISSFCLTEKLPAMFDILSRRFTTTDWLDRVRISTLINMFTAGDWSANSISNQAQRFAMRRASANLSSAGRVRELWAGMEQASFMRNLSAEMTTEATAEAQFDNLVAKMKAIGEHILTANRLRFSLHGEDASLKPAVESLNAFISGLPVDKRETPSSIQHTSTTLTTLAQNVYFALPYSVHYVSLSLPAPNFTGPEYPVYQVLAQLLNSKFLHTKIREQGGAYGGGATASPGQFAFYSYRDPFAQSTLDAFEESLDFALKTEFTEQTITEAKLSVFQGCDSPISAGSRGLCFFLSGIDDNSRQKHRELLFRVDQSGVKAVAEVLLSHLRSRSNQPMSLGRAILGPKESPNWKSSPDWQSVEILQHE